MRVTKLVADTAGRRASLVPARRIEGTWRKTMNCRFFIMMLIIFTCAAFSPEATTAFGAKAVKAPSWEGTEWINLEESEKSIDVDDFRGKVIYLTFFQKW